MSEIDDFKYKIAHVIASLDYAIHDNVMQSSDMEDVYIDITDKEKVRRTETVFEELITLIPNWIEIVNGKK